MIFLQKHNVIRINKLTVEAHGGNFTPPRNILNEQPLDYVLEIVNAEMFGEPLYPEVYDKRRFICSILSQTIFLWMETNVQV
jgi:death on curing protein